MVIAREIGKRIGFIVPSVNTIIEDDLRKFSHADVSTYVTRIALREADPMSLQKALEEAPDAARKLADCGAQVIMLACAGASMLQGPDADKARSGNAAGADDVPVTTAADAMISAMKALKLQTVSLLTPFDDRIGAIEAAFLRSAGFNVVAATALGIRDARLCAEITPDELVELTWSADSAESEGVILSCANFRAFEAVAALETRLNKPVIATNQAMLWQLFGMVGLDSRLTGGGRLFEQGQV